MSVGWHDLHYVGGTINNWCIHVLPSLRRLVRRGGRRAPLAPRRPDSLLADGTAGVPDGSYHRVVFTALALAGVGVTYVESLDVVTSVLSCSRFTSRAGVGRERIGPPSPRSSVLWGMLRGNRDNPTGRIL